MSRILFEKSVLDDFPSRVEKTGSSGPVALLISLMRSKYVATLSGATSSRYLFLPRTLRQQNRRPCLSMRTSTSRQRRFRASIVRIPVLAMMRMKL